MKAGRPVSAAIFLENMNFWGRHGVLPEERKLGGQFRVDIKMDVEAPARQSDRISETADYRQVFSRTKALVERRRFRTLEALASSVALAVMKVKRVRGARVRVTKLSPPLGGGTTAAVEVREGTMKK
jgi:dihydroneopterin aldolase